MTESPLRWLVVTDMRKMKMRDPASRTIEYPPTGLACGDPFGGSARAPGHPRGPGLPSTNWWSDVARDGEERADRDVAWMQWIRDSRTEMLQI